MTDPTPEPNRSPSADAGNRAVAALDGTWVRRHHPDPLPHKCALPPLSTVGDLWRCACGRLWAVRFALLLGEKPVRRWGRPRLRSRIRYSRRFERIDWPMFGAIALIVGCLGALAALQLSGAS